MSTSSRVIVLRDKSTSSKRRTSNQSGSKSSSPARREKKVSQEKIKVFDFFSGCGGTSQGLREAGLDIVMGLDIDSDAADTFQRNFPKAKFLCKDIRKVREEDIADEVRACGSAPLLFCGCAPCQPFSKQNGDKRANDERRDLLDEFGRFVRYFKPAFVFCENVPGMQTINGAKGPFGRLLALLTELGYKFAYDALDSQDYGVPQRRRRLVLIASRVGELKLPKPTHGPSTRRPHSTVGEWIKGLRELEQGEADPHDPAHHASRLSPLNLQRIQAIPPGGTRHDWPDELVLDCHKTSHKGHGDVYGRLRENQPASAMTTRCVSLSNGRFGHPWQHRAITVREAACLQTFPRKFKFSGSKTSMACQVGNAVPVLLARRFGREFMRVFRATRGG